MRPYPSPLLTMSLAIALPLVTLSACAPSFETYRGPSGFDRSANATGGDREANRDAFEELLDRARSAEAAPEVEPSEDATADGPVEIPLRAEPLPLGYDTVPAEANTVRRASVDALLAAGPHSVLGVVLLEPVREGGALVGYALTEIYQGGEFLVRGGLQRGDVIRSVNGTAITSPDDVMTVWERLATAEAIEVERLRAGVEETIRWEIVTDLAAAE